MNKPASWLKWQKLVRDLRGLDNGNVRLHSMKKLLIYFNSAKEFNCADGQMAR